MPPELTEATAPRALPPVSRAPGVPPLPWTGERFIPTEGGSEIYYEHAHRYMLAKSLLAGRVVVDMACGEGYGSAWIAEVAKSVVGVDIDELSVRHASVEYADRPNLRFAQGDIENLPLAGGWADAVTCFEAIEHVPNPRRVLEEVVRLLKPGGILLVSTPNKALYSDARHYSNHFHVHEFYLPDFERLLGEFFPERVLLGQRVIAGSLMWPIDGDSRDEPGKGAAGVLLAPGFNGSTVDGGRATIEAMYVVACCRTPSPDDRGTEPWPIASVLVDPEELLLESNRHPVQAAEQQAQLQASLEELERVRKESQVLRASTIALDSFVAFRSLQVQARRVGEDLDAATELNTRLLAELGAAQRTIVEMQLIPAEGPETRATMSAPVPQVVLDRLKPLLGRARRKAGW